MDRLHNKILDEFINGLERDRNRYKYISKCGQTKRQRFSARAKLGWITRRINEYKKENGQ